MRERPLTREQAEAVYDILRDECRAGGRGRESFVIYQTLSFCPEYRFMGALGFGGKFYRCNGRWYVCCYSEDVTPALSQMMEKANARLAALKTA